MCETGAGLLSPLLPLLLLMLMLVMMNEFWSAMVCQVGRLSHDLFLAGIGPTALRSFIMNEVGISNGTESALFLNCLLSELS